ncbi:MAG: aldehyde dehydrogenase family protein [Chloroflexota bacterium]|nr:aldehyde dehydrogenase family protein [Chloroflexota bacterium]
MATAKSPSKVAEFFHTMPYGPAPEDAAAAQAWLDDHGRKLDLFIGGAWIAPKSGRTIESRNPATGDLLAAFADAGTDDVDAAVKTARSAFASWGSAPGHERARVLYAIARGIQKHARLLAVIEALDNGKPIRETRDLDIPLVARHFYYYAGWAQLMAAELPGYAPLGVVGQVIPWNFPLLMLAWKIAPAIAMGNTVVIKPAPYTSLSALVLAEILHEAGLPPGVVNIVTGGDETGAAITAHPDFDKIAFTGSTNVGRIIRRVTAGTGKRLSLELGGKSPFIVFDDADQDAAVEGLVDAIWFNQGQVCCAGSRLLVQESIADRFLAKVKRRMDTLRIGSPLDKSIDIGAIVDPVQRQTIDGWVQKGLAEGAEMYQPECPLPEKGSWYLPTLLTNVQPSSVVVQEEIFGPVVVALTFRTPKEAVALANNTRYGLAASIWSESINLALDIARKVKAGTVWVNCTNMFDAASGFGGYRESGFGREGGKEGLYEYVRPAWQSRPRPTVGALDKWGAAVPGRPAALPSSPNPFSLMEKGNQSALEASVPGGEGLNTFSPRPEGEGQGVRVTLDRTPKLFIGGKQVRPDGNYSREVYGADGAAIGQVGDGNRKDVRDAVEAAHAAAGWGGRTGHNRAQILYYIAENLSARAAEFAIRIVQQTGKSAADAAREVELSIERLFTYAAYCDKFGGTMQETPLRGLTLAVNEPIGVIGIACPDEYPLLGFVSLVAPAIARGNTVIALPSQAHPLSATDFYQVLETSDVPAGVVNIVTGDREHLTKTLVEHDDVDALWYFGSAEGSAKVEELSAHNMKRTFVGYGIAVDWADAHQGAGEEFLREAVQVKNVWLPTGE